MASIDLKTHRISSVAKIPLGCGSCHGYLAQGTHRRDLWSHKGGNPAENPYCLLTIKPQRAINADD